MKMAGKSHGLNWSVCHTRQSHSQFGALRPLWYMDGGILVNLNGVFVLYDLVDHTLKHLLICGIHYFHQVDVYLESLVSPNAFKRICQLTLMCNEREEGMINCCCTICHFNVSFLKHHALMPLVLSCWLCHPLPLVLLCWLCHPYHCCKI